MTADAPDPSPPAPSAGPAGPETSAEERPRVLLALRLASLLPLLLGGLAWAASPELRASLGAGLDLLLAGDLDGLRAWARDLGAWAPLATTLLMVAQALAAPIPAFLVTATNAWLFGVLWGGLLSVASATLAAVLCFLLARAWGRPLVLRAVGPERLAELQGPVDRHGWAAVLVSRLLPFVPFDPVGYAAGLARMRLWTFTWATFLGQLPAGFFYSWVAREAVGGPARAAFFVGCGVVVLFVVGAVARRALLRGER